MQLVNLNNSYFLKQNDTATQIKLGVLDYEGNPFPLDTAEKIEVVIGVKEGRVLVKEASRLPGIGEIEFGLDEGDIVPAGDNRLEVHIYTSNGEKHVVPSKGYYKLRVQKPIDDLDVKVTTYTLDYFIDQVNKLTEGLPEMVKKAQNLVGQMQTDLDEVTQLKADAQEAANLSYEARDVANQIIDDMTTVKADAEKATLDANSAATNATSAANNANTSADNANLAADRANSEAKHAKTQGDYAKEQGDYAKEQAKLIDAVLDQGSVATVNGKTGNVTLTAEDVNAIPISEKGVAGGVARLNEEGKVVDASGNEVEGKVKSVNGNFPDESGNIEIKIETTTTSTSWNDLRDKPTSFPPSAHTHQISEVTGLQVALNKKASSEDLLQLDNKVNEHLAKYVPISEKGVAGGVARLNEEGKVVDASGNEVEGKVKSVNGNFPDESGNIEIKIETTTTSTSWNDLRDKPTSFPPSAHTHQISEVTGLQVALNKKASSEDLLQLDNKVNEHLAEYETLLSKNAIMHNNIYRGKYLGNSVTSNQYRSILNGTFEDLYIGDYWTINGVNYRIAGFNYYYNTGSIPTITNHVVIVPDTVLYDYVMNDTRTTEGAYINSKMYKEGLAQAISTIKSAFRVLKHQQILCDSTEKGKASGWVWVDSEVELMTETMVYGTSIFGGGYNVGFCKTQLPLFRLNPRMINIGKAYWLRDVASDLEFAYVGKFGNAGVLSVRIESGVRPAFSIA